jgi:hypothetical protein
MSEGKRVPGAAADKGKADRLAAALRANLKRRKAQARTKGGEGEHAPEPTPEPREDTVPK